MSEKSNSDEWRTLPDDFETISIRSSRCPENFSSQSLAIPIVPSSIFAMNEPTYEACLKEDKVTKTYFYGRKGNPTRDPLENLLAKLENCNHSLTFSSGSAAIQCILQSLLHQNCHVVAMEIIYGGTTVLLKDLKRFGVNTDFNNSFDPKVIASLVKPETKIVWLESPANPTMQLIDISETCKLVKAKNPSTIVVVDNTFLTPLFQRPLELGADISVYSCSKYLNGHADMFMGALSCNDEKLFHIFQEGQENYGAIPSPYDCYNLIRSLKTLPIRMKQHCSNGQKVAEFLESHPAVLKIFYPGLKSHPQHKLALKQQYGNSGGIGIYLKPPGLKESFTFLKSLKLVVMAPSIGTDFSVANMPSKLSHGEMPKEDLDRVGITDNFIRLSVGLENANAIIEDLDQALRHAIKCH